MWGGRVHQALPDEDVTLGLGITEGLEDGISILLSGWRPIWCASSAGAIAKFPPLGGVQQLSVFADRDDAGLTAAGAACTVGALPGVRPRSFRQRWRKIGPRLTSRGRTPARPRT